MDTICLEKTFIVFASKHELEMHTSKAHSSICEKASSRVQQKALS
jgi:hypothetical protein